MIDKKLIVLPTGRVIGGKINKKVQQYDQMKKELKFNNDGTEKMTYYFQIAIPKNTPELWDYDGVTGILTKYVECANRNWPQDINGDGYSWKIQDGDNTRDGTPNTKSFSEHARGCFIFTVSSGLQSIPKLIEPDANNNPLETKNVNNFYTGCHVKVGVTLANNGLSGSNAGIYVNPEFVVLIRHDDPISSSGISLNEISEYVGTLQPVIGSPTPAAMQPSPIQQAPAAMQPSPIQQAPAAMQPPPPIQQAPAAMQPPPPMQQQPPPMDQQPPPPMQQQPPPMDQQPPPPMQQQPPAMQQIPPIHQQPPAMQQSDPVKFTMTEMANGLTREEYRKAGWSDLQLIESGFMNSPPHSSILN